MTKGNALEALKEAAAASGLVEPTSDGVVMVSGGADSACAAAALAAVIGPERIHALHVNYGLRDAANADEQTARRLCAALRIDLHVERGLFLSMDSATANAYLQGQASLPVAIARGKVRCSGDLKTALIYLPALKLLVDPYRTWVARLHPHLSVA